MEFKPRRLDHHAPAARCQPPNRGNDAGGGQERNPMTATYARFKARWRASRHARTYYPPPSGKPRCPITGQRRRLWGHAAQWASPLPGAEGRYWGAGRYGGRSGQHMTNRHGHM